MEIGIVSAWYLFFAIFLLGFAFVLWKKKEIRYFFYFMFGTMLGLCLFDLPSIAFGYYAYSTNPYFLPLYGVPLTVSLEEGFAAAITIYVYEFLARMKRNGLAGIRTPGLRLSQVKADQASEA